MAVVHPFYLSTWFLNYPKESALKKYIFVYTYAHIHSWKCTVLTLNGDMFLLEKCSTRTKFQKNEPRLILEKKNAFIKILRNCPTARCQERQPLYAKAISRMNSL